MSASRGVGVKTAAKPRGASGGFTLVELLVVIVILSIIAGIVVFAVGTTTSNAVTASCASDAKTIETALSTYDAQMGTYPTSIGALVTTTADAAGNPVGPWLRAIPGTDHYVFFSDTDGTLYVIPPNDGDPTVSGSYSIGTVSDSATAGGAWDVDANPSICSQFS